MNYFDNLATNLESDIKVLPVSSRRYDVYFLRWGKWERVDEGVTNMQVNQRVGQDYKQITPLDNGYKFSGVWRYRLIRPDWYTFKLWLEQNYFELLAANQDLEEENGYNTVIYLVALLKVSYDDLIEKGKEHTELAESRGVYAEWKIYNDFVGKLLSWQFRNERSK